MEDSTDKQPENLTRGERKRLQKELSKENQKSKIEAEKITNRNKDIQGYVIIGIGTCLFILVAFFLVKLMIKDNTEFANCLSQKGVVVYGNDWCQYTQKQKNLFGNSFNKLNYVICDENTKICDEKNIKITPTWEIDGKLYEQVQPLSNIARLSGCALK